MIGPKVKFVLTYIFLKKHILDDILIPWKYLLFTQPCTTQFTFHIYTIHPIIYVYVQYSVSKKYVGSMYILLDWLNFDHQHTLFSIYCWSLSWKRHEFGPVSQKRYMPQCVWNEKIITIVWDNWIGDMLTWIEIRKRLSLIIE